MVALMAQTVTSVRRCQPMPRRRVHGCALVRFGGGSALAPNSDASERRRPVSMSTVTLMPARSSERSCPGSKTMRTGTRCTTFTQLPMAFCGGRIANCAPVPGLIEATVPWKVWSGNASTSIVDLLADPQIGDVGFLRIGVDPGRAVVDDAEDRRAGGDEAAELDIVDLRGGAGDRRLERGVVEIALRLVEHRLGLLVGRELLDRQIGIAEQRVERGRLLLDANCTCSSRGDQRRRWRCRGRPASRRDFGGSVVLRSTSLCLSVDVLLAELDQLVERFEVALQVVEIGAHAVELALRLAQREAERRRIDLEQHVAGGDVLALLHHGRG